MKTTLNEIRKHEPCQDFWETLLSHLNKTEPDEEALPLLIVLESSGLEETLWCFRAVEGFHKEKRLLAIAFAREVEHLMPEASKPALDVAERFANGLATEEELAQARAAAWAAHAAAARYAASWAAAAAWAAAYAADARPAAYPASWEAWSADAELYATYAADSRTAAYAASAADSWAAWSADADWKCARSEMQAKQTQILRKFLEETV